MTQVDGARRGHDGTLTAGRPPQAPPRAVTVALAGNPNCGKTTLFNALTGSRQPVSWSTKDGILAAMANRREMANPSS